jgi:hypothetical protein
MGAIQVSCSRCRRKRVGSLPATSAGVPPRNYAGCRQYSNARTWWRSEVDIELRIVDDPCTEDAPLPTRASSQPDRARV